MYSALSIWAHFASEGHTHTCMYACMFVYNWLPYACIRRPFCISLKHVLIPFNFVKLHKLQIVKQIKVLIVLVWHCGCAANLFHYVYLWHMYTVRVGEFVRVVKICKSGCSRVQCANVCPFILQYTVLYTVTLMLYVLSVVSMHLQSCMLFLFGALH